MPDLTRIPTARDPRLDVFRGICLVMIFINHVPDTVFETLTSRNFGFSDAAEGFVMMSGVAAGLAYSAGFRTHATWAAARRIWRRVWTLYMVHILVTMLAIAVSAAAMLWLQAPQLMHENQLDVLFEHPLGFLVGVPMLTHQLGYANILPLYAVLLGVSPLLIMVGLRWPRTLLAGSVMVWAAAGQFRLNLPNFPNPGGWFFNPFAWQLLFVIGLLTGIALKEGRRFLPVNRVWLILAAGYLILALVWTKSSAVAGFMGTGMWQLGEWGLPFYIHAFDKTFVTLPRLLHILAIAYLLSSLPWFRIAAASKAAAPFAVLGRNSLPVFAAGTVLCFGVQAIKDATGAGFVLDGLLIGSGLGLQYALASLTERWKAPVNPRVALHERPAAFDPMLHARPIAPVAALAEA